MGLSVGLPRMHKESRERRDFLPRFVHGLERLGAEDVVVERGYGSAIGLSDEDYVEGTTRVRIGEARECLAQDVVLVLRCPDEFELRGVRPGAILVSMLHYRTRPKRNALLRELGIRGVSLDGVVDDRGRRMVENMELVGWSGVGAAFRCLADARADLSVPARGPIRVTCLGSGAVGLAAVHAATRYGDPELRATLHAAKVPGVEVTVIDEDLSWHEPSMKERLAVTDLLIDATHRPDPTLVVIPNAWLGVMPPHAVLLDLSADPYDLAMDPPAVKGIEGIPHGDLDGYEFPPDHPAWDAFDGRIDSAQRRTALSCNAWPGIRPEASMALYGEQVEPVMEVVLQVPIDRWDPQAPTQRERAVARAELQHWSRGHTG
jgi:alanine dehydrogenase